MPFVQPLVAVFSYGQGQNPYMADPYFFGIIFRLPYRMGLWRQLFSASLAGISFAYLFYRAGPRNYFSFSPAYRARFRNEYCKSYAPDRMSIRDSLRIANRFADNLWQNDPPRIELRSPASCSERWTPGVAKRDAKLHCESRARPLSGADIYTPHRSEGF